MKQKSRFCTARRILLFWTLFIGLGAVAGALAMLLDPSGKSMGMDAMLPYFQVLPFADVVFQDFTFSGWALLIVNGLTNLTAAGLLLAKKHSGVVLGGVFGAVSFYDAITGASAMTGALFQVSPLNTFILCVGMRVLMGLCCGLIFKGLQKLDKSRTWSYILSAMTAPALNTLFFMGYIVLAFYGCDYVQNLVSVKGAANPFMFVVLLVGVQGVAEFLVSGILGGIVARAVAKYLK